MAERSVLYTGRDVLRIEAEVRYTSYATDDSFLEYVRYRRCLCDFCTSLRSPTVGEDADMPAAKRAIAAC
jgi:hypothetical protein